MRFFNIIVEKSHSSIFLYFYVANSFCRDAGPYILDIAFLQTVGDVHERPVSITAFFQFDFCIKNKLENGSKFALNSHCLDGCFLLKYNKQV